MASSIMINCTGGRDEPERAILSFVVGNTAATADQDAVVLLTIEGVWLATRGYGESIRKDGLPPLPEVMESFVANGGQIWACGACTGPRGITEGDLVSGARIVTAANVVERMAAGASMISF